MDRLAFLLHHHCPQFEPLSMGCHLDLYRLHPRNLSCLNCVPLNCKLNPPVVIATVRTHRNLFDRIIRAEAWGVFEIGKVEAATLNPSVDVQNLPCSTSCTYITTAGCNPIKQGGYILISRGFSLCPGHILTGLIGMHHFFPDKTLARPKQHILIWSNYMDHALKISLAQLNNQSNNK